MADFPFDMVAFDLDGTLADTAPDLAAALNHALARLGRPTVPVDSVRHLVGHGARTLLRKGLATSGDASEALVEQGFPFFLEHYAAHICDGSSAYPGLDDALDALKARGVKLALCTNKQEGLTHLLIDAIGWTGRFDAIVGGDTLPVRKPDPAPLHEAIARAGGGRAVFVGDSITDADTAKAAGIPFVAVSFGFSDRPAEQLGADALIHSHAELIPTLERLKGDAP
ncbi:phosphoglycolate phosphatase [Sphingosinicella sp. LHD-64]|uniref:phosphoglycolate phosphatase n=1 Tax=Sphingosinicella sp. LHD-64 TaxID=3072139 RepID=UPI00280D87CE|nr:phosphoglycolate phosphatase [Sphingosinicella sp. LHD-64]MDQ8757784.1 phosphoglycolate phosphatase [Sphingosinicella sp. LHD-64]